MNQSFVARVRGTVRKSLETSDDVHHTMVDNVSENLKPNLRLPKVATGIRELDPDELSGAGARATCEPLGNILGAKFVGVNKNFLDMFGFDKSELPSSTFKILQGPLTDTKHLQEVTCLKSETARRAAREAAAQPAFRGFRPVPESATQRLPCVACAD